MSRIRDAMRVKSSHAVAQRPCASYLQVHLHHATHAKSGGPSCSSMHDCLRVPEIVGCIAEACVPRYGATETGAPLMSLKSVCALARACRGFYEPASNVVWRYQSGLRHLLACIRGVGWEVRECRQQFATIPLIADEDEIKNWVGTGSGIRAKAGIFTCAR